MTGVQPPRPGLTYLDPDKLHQALVRSGLSRGALAARGHFGRNTLTKAFRGDGIRSTTAGYLAKALGVDVADLLSETNFDRNGEPAGREVGNWQLEEYLGPWFTTSNGLQYRLCRLTHRLVEGRTGRAKLYDLLHLAQQDRARLRDHLLRHPTVCERLAGAEHVAENLDVFHERNEAAWWVVDRWVDATTLDERLRQGPLPKGELARLMRQIATGLESLHRAEVVFRELAPRRVLLLEREDKVVLTDFELAKLTDGRPTVSADWRDDPYRAPEVAAGSADARADLYSWALVLVHAATGELPARGKERAALAAAGLPKPVEQVASKCLSAAPSRRPASLDEVLRLFKRWR